MTISNDLILQILKNRDYILEDCSIQIAIKLDSMLCVNRSIIFTQKQAHFVRQIPRMSNGLWWQTTEITLRDVQSINIPGHIKV